MLNQPKEIVKTITSESTIFSLRKDGIVTVEPLPHYKSLSTDILALDFKVLDDLTDEYPILLLSDNRKLYGLNSEQRNHVKAILNQKAKKCAVLLNTDLAKYFFNFFNHLYKLKIPVKAFSNKNDAIEWLKNN